MEFPEELIYSKEHVWLRKESASVLVGLTEFALQQLGMLEAIELAGEGDQVEQEDSMGSVEGRNSASELYSPVSGTVMAVNEELLENPGLVSDDPYDSGWLLEIRLDDPDELNLLMSVDDYLEYVEECEI